MSDFKTIQRAYKTELAPTSEQRAMMDEHASVARFVFNWGLAECKRRYDEVGRFPSVYNLKKHLNFIKSEQFPFVSKVNCYASQSAFDDLGKAFKNFNRELRKFRTGQRKDRPGFPRFKSKDKSRKSFRLYKCIHVVPSAGEVKNIGLVDGLKVPSIGLVLLKERGYFPAFGVKILNITISEQAGRWFCSLQVEQEAATPTPRPESVVGVDVGIKTLATCSDGQVFENPKALKAAQRKLKRLSREKDRRKKGSANRKKTTVKLGKAHYRVSCIRKDALHQATHRITRDHTTVVLEDLNVAGMVKNHNLAGAVSDASFSEFRRQCEYKSEWRGGRVLLADRWEPSSKRCSACGAVKETLLLSERVYRCEVCGLIVDRDLNAAINLKMCVGVDPATVAGRTLETLNDCGGSRFMTDSQVTLCEAVTLRQNGGVETEQDRRTNV